jgi:hypothetical protein
LNKIRRAARKLQTTMIGLTAIVSALNAELANYARREKMVCATRAFEALYLRNQPRDVPSPEHIRQLALAIRKGWSPQTRAKRTAAAAYRVDVLLTLAQLRNRENLLNRMRSR